MAYFDKYFRKRYLRNSPPAQNCVSKLNFFPTIYWVEQLLFAMGSESFWRVLVETLNLNKLFLLKSLLFVIRPHPVTNILSSSWNWFPGSSGFHGRQTGIILEILGFSKNSGTASSSLTYINKKDCYLNLELQVYHNLWQYSDISLAM